MPKLSIRNPNDIEAAAATVVLAVDSLVLSHSLRIRQVSHDHARSLANCNDELPPIVVRRSTMEVIDGVHRLRAKGINGHHLVTARFFDGPEDDAFVLAVKSNVTGGLPLTLAEREAAAARIITSHPAWSDRAIGTVTGLAGKTVAGIRRRSAGRAQATFRIGRDGRARPVDATQGRLRASEVITARPQASVREIARIAGVSVSTAHDVRDRMYRGEHPVPPRLRAVQDGGAEEWRPQRARCDAHGGVGRAELLERIRQDPALRYTDSGRSLMRLLNAQLLDAERSRQLVDTVPGHWAETVAAAARACAEEWQRVAAELACRGQEGGRRAASGH